jgi:hypothetical protein
MKIRLAYAVLFRDGRRTDEHTTHMTNLIVVFCNFANAPKKRCRLTQSSVKLYSKKKYV